MRVINNISSITKKYLNKVLIERYDLRILVSRHFII